ncbi:MULTISPECIES: hypothetical protein [Cryobacterium]|uniref:hypothetical protein n=1 Tax=Cryobacterium TaxID=69578 RepID=UPI000CD3CED6|nr:MULTISPECIES: hypothetical protein [Cryobacterium]POH63612.1 hypothetical protein C3B60_15960 [Cryobacterium zongtaii]TFC44068.1 hypothetical protein E3O57_11545 [Cryobacterium sp. TMN-39-2]
MNDDIALNPATGEVDEDPSTQLVQLNLADLNEDELLEMFPSPVQAAGALLLARRVLADAPAILNTRSKALKDAKRTLLVARGYARMKAAGKTADDRRVEQEADASVITAGEWVDTCELALEYAREVRKSLSEDIDILRSLNTNFRAEHKS